MDIDVAVTKLFVFQNKCINFKVREEEQSEQNQYSNNLFAGPLTMF